MARLTVRNESASPIEVQVFGGVPFVSLERERKDEPEGLAFGAVGRCGNGYEAVRIPAGSAKTFPLWSLPSHAPREPGTYRAHLPYTEIRSTPTGRRLRHKEAVSPRFRLRYGDTPPRHWVATQEPGSVVLVSATAAPVLEGVAPAPDAVAVAGSLAEPVRACMAEAHRRLPWLRGGFALRVYRYPSNDAPVLYLDHSLLGDADVNACLSEITPPDDLAGSYALHFVVTPPPRE